MEAGKFIKDLLYQADTVRIPGLGTFISSYLTSRTDFTGKKISPAVKSFQFDDSRKEDDELMWTWISEQEGLSENEARMMVADFVADVSHELHEGREVTIDGLGTFFGDVTGHTEFHFSVENNFNADSIGFEELDLPDPGHEGINSHHDPEIHSHEEHIPVAGLHKENPILHETPHEVQKEIHQPSHEPEVQLHEIPPHVAHKDKKSHRGVWIAIVILIIIGGITFLAYQQRQRIGQLTKTWFSKPVQLADTNKKKQPADTGLGKTLEEQARMKKALDVQAIDSDKVFIPYGSRHMKYYIVTASFTNYENALKLKNELRGKGFDSEIVTVTHKYYKVTMGSYPDKQQAQVELEKLKTITQNNSLWLLHI